MHCWMSAPDHQYIHLLILLRGKREALWRVLVIYPLRLRGQDVKERVYMDSEWIQNITHSSLLHVLQSAEIYTR